MHRVDGWRMIKQRAKATGLPEAICSHTFRATGITAYFENGGTIEHAQAIANHESPKTTKFNDRTSDQITLDEVERIVIWASQTITRCDSIVCNFRQLFLHLQLMNEPLFN
jgi:integrase/recombinase XerD